MEIEINHVGNAATMTFSVHIGYAQNCNVSCTLYIFKLVFSNIKKKNLKAFSHI